MQIVIPKNSLIVLCGPSGCGKSTLANRFFLKSQIVSSDYCRELICDDNINQVVSHIAFDLFYSIIEKRLFLDKLTVADSTALDHDVRKSLLTLAKDYNRPCVIIIINIPLEESLKRNKTRKREVEESVIMRHYDELKKLMNLIDKEGFTAFHIISDTEDTNLRV